MAGSVGAFREAAGYGHPEACYHLGCLYETGQGIEADAQQALGWFERAAVQGSAAAMLKLVPHYAGGDCVPQDLGRVRSLLNLTRQQSLAFRSRWGHSGSTTLKAAAAR